MENKEQFVNLLPGPLILCVGFIIQIVGFSTTHWSERTSTSATCGLWKVCTHDDDKSKACFTITQRGSVPIMVFLCSFLGIVSAIITGLSFITAVFTTCQKKSTALRWSKNSAAATLLAVALSVSVECIYGATYSSITYDNIPNLNKKSTTTELSWSFFLYCSSSVILLIGSLYLIIVPSNILSTNKVSTNMPQIPVLQIHPPPSDRAPTPLYLLSQRSSSPLPSPFSSNAHTQHTQSLPPVFTQMRR
ncbi:unnamed protein product [Mytilus edulis]|uniref:Uncharacterized protein n=1 Tax=Mytilus edulis TaxID=6550 RepID=A0A8S3QBC8_MYTED|nr:unnamed protein product [Mytilus edulis]